MVTSETDPMARCVKSMHGLQTCLTWNMLGRANYIWRMNHPRESFGGFYEAMITRTHFDQSLGLVVSTSICSITTTQSPQPYQWPGTSQLQHWQQHRLHSVGHNSFYSHCHHGRPITFTVFAHDYRQVAQLFSVHFGRTFSFVWRPAIPCATSLMWITANGSSCDC